MMSLAARLDQVPPPIWIALAMLGFFFCWPLGLAMLACLIWSGTMGCCGMGCGHANETTYRRTQAWRPDPQTSGNHAFDEYRTATLRRLEEEQHEFRAFLSRLRSAKDKAEFDQFMAERGTRSAPQT